MRRRFVYSLVLMLALIHSDAFAQIDYPELQPVFRSRMIRQNLLLKCSDPFDPPANRTVAVGNLRVFLQSPSTKGASIGEIRVESKLTVGNVWEIHIGLLFAGCRVWKADLDRNGKEDLIVVSWDMVNGPGMEVTLVFIDEQNRPVPWHSPVAYFDFEDHGLENLVDLDEDRRAELLVLHVDGRPGDPAVETVTRYRITTNGLKRIDGPFAGRVFPIVSPRNAPASKLDWSTDVDGSPSGVTIRSILPKCPKPMIRIDDPKNYECRIALSDNTVLLGRPDIIVIDGSNGRRIEFGSLEKVDQMLEEVRLKGYQVRFTCKLLDTMCQPFLLWATEKKN